MDITRLKVLLERAVLEERKACAKICFDYKERLAHISYSDWPSGHTAAEDCMEEINERSNDNHMMSNAPLTGAPETKEQK